MSFSTWDDAAAIFDSRNSAPDGFNATRSSGPSGFNPVRGNGQGFNSTRATNGDGLASPRGGGMGGGMLPADAQWGAQQGIFANFGEQQNALAAAAIAESNAAIQAAIEAQEKMAGGGGNAAPANAGGDGWEFLNQYDRAYTSASNTTGVPGNMIKAIQALETGRADYNGQQNCSLRTDEGGKPNCVALNSGIFRTTAEAYGLDYERIVKDPEYAALAIGVVLQNIANSDASEWGGEAGQTVLEQGGWLGVAAVYHGGDINAGFVDENGVGSSEYMKNISMYLEQLGGVDAPVGRPEFVPAGVETTTSYTPTTANNVAIAHAPPGSSIDALPDMWGGSDEYISQGLGENTGASYNNDPHIYDYAKEYGFEGHPGLDIALPAGSPLTSAISGQVVLVGGDYFTDPYGVGELRIVAPNGDVVILGHMRSTHLKPGDMVNAGDPVGTSGQSDQRAESAHLHLEVRVAQPDGTFLIADPAAYFSPAPTGGPR